MRNLYKVFFINKNYNGPSVFYIVAEQFCQLGKKIEEIRKHHPSVECIDKIEVLSENEWKSATKLDIWIAK